MRGTIQYIGSIDPESFGITGSMVLVYRVSIYKQLMSGYKYREDYGFLNSLTGRYYSTVDDLVTDILKNK